jgi:hypothetical protein
MDNRIQRIPSKALFLISGILILKWDTNCGSRLYENRLLQPWMDCLWNLINKALRGYWKAMLAFVLDCINNSVMSLCCGISYFMKWSCDLLINVILVLSDSYHS